MRFRDSMVAVNEYSYSVHYTIIIIILARVQ